jgi:CheY-like chemotaxis protein
VDGSTTRRRRHGLGLAISKQLVNLMGGEMGVHQPVGQGLHLLVHAALQLDAQPHAEPVPVADLRGLRVLIVDDNEVNRRVLHEQITSWEMRNGSLRGRRQALQALREARAAGDPYQVALLDYQMPEMDGATLAAAIKADPLLSDTVVIMLTLGGPLERGAAHARSRHRRLPGEAGAAIAVAEHAGDGMVEETAERGSRRGRRRTEIAAVKSKLAGRFAGPAPVRVLVAEDNVVNQKVAVRMLERLGCARRRGQRARGGGMCAMLPYDLIFMDCQMPEMDGYAATARFGSGKGRMAGGDHRDDGGGDGGRRERCLAAGMDDYIAKPVRLDDMIEALKKWVPVMFLRRSLGACAALMLALHGAGLAQQYSFRHYGAADGLQNLSILTLAQDGAGYIWAGAEGGLLPV